VGWARAFALAAALVVPANAGTVSEDDVRVAMLLNFARFTEWPANTWTDPSAPLVIGVVAPDELVEVLELAAYGKRIGNHPLSVLRLSSIPEAVANAGRCHLLYSAGTEGPAARALLRGFESRPVLVVGSSPGFTRLGGSIGFVIENRHLRFEISQKAVERAGLRVSSKLLELAKRVDGPRDTR
jgi:hypothetical protein